MAMSLSAIQEVFKNVGKVIYLTQQTPTDETAYKLLSSALMDQIAAGGAAQYEALQELGINANSTIKKLQVALNAVPAQAKANIESYFRKVVAVDLGLVANATMAAVGTAFIADMVTSSAHVDPSGTGGSNDDGFAMYFYNNWGWELNQDASPSCPDSWITATVV